MGDEVRDALVEVHRHRDRHAAAHRVGLERGVDPPFQPVGLVGRGVGRRAADDLPARRDGMQRAREHLQRVLERAHVEPQQARHEQDRRARRVLDQLVAREPQAAAAIALASWPCGAPAAAAPRRIEQRGRHGRPSRSAAQPPPTRRPAAPAPRARRPRAAASSWEAVMPEAITCAVAGLSESATRSWIVERDVGHERVRRRRRDLAQVGEHRADRDAVALARCAASPRPRARRRRGRRRAPSPAARRRSRRRPTRSRGPRARRPARARAAARGTPRVVGCAPVPNAPGRRLDDDLEQPSSAAGGSSGERTSRRPATVHARPARRRRSSRESGTSSSSRPSSAVPRERVELRAGRQPVAEERDLGPLGVERALVDALRAAAASGRRAPSSTALARARQRRSATRRALTAGAARRPARGRPARRGRGR